MSLPYAYQNSIGFGSVLLTMLTGNGANVSYIANDLNGTEPTFETSRTTELGAPNGFVLFKEPRTLSGTLQLQSNVTPLPGASDEFNYTWPNVGPITFVLTEVSQSKEPRKIWDFNMSAREKI